MMQGAAPTASDRRSLTRELFHLAAGQSSEAERAETLGSVVTLNTPLARRLAHRYRDRGCDIEDLEQTACLALVRAVRRFDITSGHDFLSYAVPSIRGEIKKHFRDLGWMIRPPRRLQELQPLVKAEQLKRNPATGDTLGIEAIATNLGTSPGAVRQAMQAQGCFSPTSLDTPTGDDVSPVLGDTVLQFRDPGFAEVEARTLLGSVLSMLSPRDRSVLQMRFVEELTQSEMAELLGMTQPQVSRLLRRILTDLREIVAEPTSSLRDSA